MPKGKYVNHRGRSRHRGRSPEKLAEEMKADAKKKNRSEKDLQYECTKSGEESGCERKSDEDHKERVVSPLTEMESGTRSERDPQNESAKSGEGSVCEKKSDEDHKEKGVSNLTEMESGARSKKDPQNESDEGSAESDMNRFPKKKKKKKNRSKTDPQNECAKPGEGSFCEKKADEDHKEKGVSNLTEMESGARSNKDPQNESDEGSAESDMNRFPKKKKKKKNRSKTDPQNECAKPGEGSFCEKKADEDHKEKGVSNLTEMESGARSKKDPQNESDEGSAESDMNRFPKKKKKKKNRSKTDPQNECAKPGEGSFCEKKADEDHKEKGVSNLTEMESGARSKKDPQNESDEGSAESDMNRFPKKKKKKKNRSKTDPQNECAKPGEGSFCEKKADEDHKEKGVSNLTEMESGARSKKDPQNESDEGSAESDMNRFPKKKEKSLTRKQKEPSVRLLSIRWLDI